jgi:uncharacterized protein DUF5671
MAVADELITFVKDALGRGIARADVEQVLRRAGWSAEQVAGALAAFADVDFAVPVPRPRPYVSAREAFMYVVMFMTLYTTAWSLGNLVFEFIDRAFPDPAMRRSTEFSLAVIRWSVSSLVVACPVFLYVGSLVARSIRRDPTKRASKIRRNLTYVTLFVASCMLLGDVTTLVYNLLGGELTVRFVLKALTVGLIAGAAFVYYLTGLRHDEKEVPQ